LVEDTLEGLGLDSFSGMKGNGHAQRPTLPAPAMKVNVTAFLGKLQAGAFERAYHFAGSHSWQAGHSNSHLGKLCLDLLSAILLLMSLLAGVE
jgi:hypothetical protein